MPDRNEVAKQNYALALVRYDALNNTVRRLADLVNQHTLLIAALMKVHNQTPDQLLALLKPEDFINPADNPLIETGEKVSPVELADADIGAH